MSESKQLLMRDLNGFLYLVPKEQAMRCRVAPEALPAMLEQLAQELPEINWKERVNDAVRMGPAAAKAVDAVISFGGSVAASEAVQKLNECCVADCCVVDCCVADCPDHQPDPPADPIEHCVRVDGPNCRPVR